MSNLRAEFEAASELNESERSQLAEYIKFIFANSGSKGIKSAIALSSGIKRHTTDIVWPDMSISKFLTRPASYLLPEGSKQRDIFQLIKDWALDLDYGQEEKEPVFEGPDPDLYKNLKAIFTMSSSKENHLNRGYLYISQAAFSKAFQEVHPDLRLFNDAVGKYIREEGKKPHNFPVSLRNALMDFSNKFLREEIEIGGKRTTQVPQPRIEP